MADLRFGSYLAPSLLPLYEAVSDGVGRALGLTTELVVESSLDSFGDDQNDVCFICGLPYVLAERAGHSPAVPIAAPVLTGARYGGLPVYFSDVVVRHDGELRAFADLHGRSWAFNEPRSLSGYGLVRARLLEAGETDGFFSEIVEAGSHAEAMAMVARGAVEWAAIDSHVLAVAQREDPGLRRSLRVVDQLGPAPIPPVTVSRRVPADLRLAIEAALGRLHEDPVMRPVLGAALVERYVAVGAETYDPIRAMVVASQAAGFVEVR